MEAAGVEPAGVPGLSVSYRKLTLLKMLDPLQTAVGRTYSTRVPNTKDQAGLPGHEPNSSAWWLKPSIYEVPNIMSPAASFTDMAVSTYDSQKREQYRGNGCCKYD